MALSSYDGVHRAYPVSDRMSQPRHADRALAPGIDHVVVRAYQGVVNSGHGLTSLPHRYLAESYLEVGGGLGSHEFGSTGLREVLERRIEAIKKNRLSSILEDILGLPDPSRPYYKGYLERSDEVLVLLSFLGFTPEQITDEIERILK